MKLEAQRRCFARHSVAADALTRATTFALRDGAVARDCAWEWKAIESIGLVGLKQPVESMLTNKAKYALRAMIDLATHSGSERRPLLIGDIAKRQDIPRRFLENILLELRNRGFVVSHRGKAGGYALARSADLITFADIIRAIDGPLALTSCTSRSAYQRCEDCKDEATCAIRRSLIQVRDATASILERTTLAGAAEEAAGKAPRTAAPATVEQD